MIELNPMQDAPKKSVILLDVGYPWLVAGIWNAPSESWVYADLQIDLYEGEWNDTYFENEHEKKPNGWMPLPEPHGC